MENEISMLVYATFSVVFVTFGVGIFTIYYRKKENQRSALIDVFDIFNESHKNDENTLTLAFERDQLYVNGKIEESYCDKYRKVTRKYDEVGLLVSNGMVPKNDYYRMWGVLTVMMYHILKKEFDASRIKHPHHRIYFKDLALDSFSYCARSNISVKDPKGNIINSYDIF